jgi:hypothetical protein
MAKKKRKEKIPGTLFRPGSVNSPRATHITPQLAMTSSAALLSVQKPPRRYKISHFLRFVPIFILVASAGIYDAWRTDSVNEAIRKRS